MAAGAMNQVWSWAPRQETRRAGETNRWMALHVEAIQRSPAILLHSFQAAPSRRHSMTMHAAASQTRETAMHSAAAATMYGQRPVERQ